MASAAGGTSQRENPSSAIECSRSNRDMRWAIGDGRWAIGGDDCGVVTSSSLPPKPNSFMKSLRFAAAAQLALATTLFGQQTSAFTVGSASAAPGITAYGSIAIPAGSDPALTA